MSDRAAFMKRIIEDKFSDAPRLVFADWLEEHGEPGRAEFIRLQIELENAKNQCSCRRCMQRHGPGPHQHTNGPCAADRLSVKVNGVRQHARFREHTLFEEHGKQWLADDFDGDGKSPQHCTKMLVFLRGFLSGIEISAHMWLKHADKFTKHAPIERVKLMSTFVVTMKTYEAGSFGNFVWEASCDGIDQKYVMSQKEYKSMVTHNNEIHRLMLKNQWPDIEFVLPGVTHDQT